MRSHLQAGDERGAALILAIAVMVVVGLVATASLGLITTSVNDRATLDKVRDRQYAADGAVEYAVAQVRGLGGAGPALTPCSGPYFQTLDGVAIRVDCSDVPTLSLGGFLQRNVIFTACASTGVPCTDADPTAPSATVVRVQVNYAATSLTSPNVTRTWVQAWSVNR